MFKIGKIQIPKLYRIIKHCLNHDANYLSARQIITNIVCGLAFPVSKIGVGIVYIFFIYYKIIISFANASVP